MRKELISILTLALVSEAPSILNITNFTYRQYLASNSLFPVGTNLFCHETPIGGNGSTTTKTSTTATRTFSFFVSQSILECESTWTQLVTMELSIALMNSPLFIQGCSEISTHF